MNKSNVHNRPNKQAKGFTKHYEQRFNKGQKINLELSNHHILLGKLAIFGTTDHLAKNTNFYIKKLIIEHPIDKGYFKEVYVLSDMGKKRLKTMKQLKANNLPLWFYMTNPKSLCNESKLLITKYNKDSKPFQYTIQKVFI